MPVQVRPVSTAFERNKRKTGQIGSDLVCGESAFQLESLIGILKAMRFYIG